MTDNQPEGSTSTPKWLKKISQNSWEAEILISGGAIFSLIHAADNWVELFYLVKNLYGLPGQGPIFLIGMLAINALTIGFVMHLLTRAFWVALVCIQLAFPKGLAKPVQFKKPFDSLNAGETIFNQIDLVNRISGIIFYFSIFITISIAGLIFALALYVFLIIQLEGNAVMIFAEYVFSVLFLAYMFDLVLFGILRKIPYIAKMFYPIALFFDIISLRFVYAKSTSLLTGNISKWKIVISMVLFFFCTLLYSYPYMYKPMHWPNILSTLQYRNYLARNETAYSKFFYESNYTENDQIRYNVMINEEFIDDYLKITVVYDPIAEEFMQRKIKLTGDTMLTNTYLEDMVTISIDDSLYANLEWMENKRISDSQWGIITVIDVKNLAHGKHIMKFAANRKYYPEDVGYNYEDFVRDIPFWKK